MGATHGTGYQHVPGPEGVLPPLFDVHVLEYHSRTGLIKLIVKIIELSPRRNVRGGGKVALSASLCATSILTTKPVSSEVSVFPRTFAM